MNIENAEQFRPQPKQNSSLREAYKLVHKKEPTGLSDYEIARGIIEVLTNKNWVPETLAQKCVKAIRSEIEYPDEISKTKTLTDLGDFISHA